jgi:hypothetical protein
MPATALTSVVVNRTVANGVDLTAALTAADGTNGNTFANSGDTLLRVKNASGSPVTVTVAFAAAVDGQTVAARTYSIPATTGDRLLGPFPPALFGTSPTVTFSSGTSVTVAAFEPSN